MKKFTFVAILALAAGMMSMPVIAADDDGEKKFTVHGEVRTRWEYLENMTDITDTTDLGAFDDTFSFLPYRARVSVHGQFTKNVEGVIEIQNFGNFGNEAPEKGSQFPPTASFGAIDNSEIDLYQAYIRMNEVGGSKLYLQLGRQEIVKGKELLLGDNDYYNGMAFDGLLGGWGFENWDLNFFALTINDRNMGTGLCFVGGGANACPDDNVNLYGGDADFYIGDNGMVVSPYLIYYRDGAGTAGVNPNGFPGSKTYTLGARFGKDVGVDDDGLIDWNIEAAYQSGDVDVNGADLSAKAYISEGWIGFNFHGDNSMHRIGGGYLITSGDDDFADQDAEAFQPLFADIHANNRLGNIDFGGMSLSGVFGIVGGFGIPGIDTGITDGNIRYNGTFGNHGIMAAVHMLLATEIDENFFGTGYDDDLGIMLDLGYDYTYSKNLSFGIELSTFQPGGFFEGLDTTPNSTLFEDDIIRVAAQARLRF